MFDLTDKVVLLTGATGGIGKSIAEALLNNGSKVIGVSKQKLSKKNINHKNYFHYFCDIEQERNIIKTLNQVKKNLRISTF